MNWGTKIVIGMALFMTFIIGMAVRMITSSSDDLVEKDYYEKGLTYDKSYQEQNEAFKDAVIPDMTVDEQGLRISFKQAADYKLVCKRPSDSKLDASFEGTVQGNQSVVISNKDLKAGPWSINIEFSTNGKQYLVERKIVML